MTNILIPESTATPSTPTQTSSAVDTPTQAAPQTDHQGSNTNHQGNDMLHQDSDMLWIEPWDDPVTDPLGHDPVSKYVELFWLPILGPSSLWLLRRVSLMLQDSPSGFSVKTCDLAQEIGLGSWRGPRSPFMRAIERCCDFKLAVSREESFIYVRRRMPTLGRRLIHRLPLRLRELHSSWMFTSNKASDSNPLLRARNLALALLATGDTPEATEQTLLAWGLHPAIAPDAVYWANTRLSAQEE